MLNRLIAIFFLTLSILPLTAQDVVWSVDATILLNNREGGDAYTPDQTFMFTRLAPEVGVDINDGEHLFKGGVVWYQPMDDNLRGYKILPSLYYRYNRTDGWHVGVGLMPRTLMVKRMPRYLWSDSLDYCQPNLKGVLLQLIKPAGYAELGVDWRQLQTDNRREAFTTMLNTDWRVAGPFRLGGHLQYSHLALSKQNSELQHVSHDFTINPMAGIDLSHRSVLDSLRIDAGAIIALESTRADRKWQTPAGFVATATARWRWIQLDETFYTGKGILPMYPTLGSLLYQGDPYYNNKTYSRTDITFHVVSNRYIDLTGSLMLHATDKTTGFWQQIACRIYLSGKTKSIND